jgi:uncharacterized protein YlzI (FlbEa/FlbD family)
MILHDALANFEGQEIGVVAADVVDYGVEHSLPMDATRVVLNNGDQLVVRETVEEIERMIEEETK